MFSSNSVSFFLLSSLLASSNSANALKCGIKGITEPCIGDSDIRYDADEPYDLKSQSSFWENYEGLTSGLNYRYDPQGQPATGNVIDGLEFLGKFNMFPSKIFSNVTVYGSRYIKTEYEIFDNAVEGAPGLVFVSQVFNIATHEKDGGVNIFAAISPLHGDDEPFQLNEDRYMMRPSSNTTAEINAAGAGGGVPYDLQATFLTDGTSEARVETYYIYPPQAPGTRIMWYLLRTEQMKKEESTWLEELDGAFSDGNVFTSETLPPGFPARFGKPAAPVNTVDCVKADQSLCPTEEDWRKVDPDFNESPYVEPAGVLTGLAIAVIVLVTIAVAAALVTTIIKSMMKKQKDRLQKVFITAIGSNIEGGFKADLSAAELQKLFKKVDTNGNGLIEKEELWASFESGEAGKMSRKDFNYLFGSIDLDNNGTLTFVEFTSFFGTLDTSNTNETFDDENGVYEA